MIRSLEELSPLEKLSLIDISASRLSTYAMCNAKYFYTYITKDERVFGPAAALGSTLHSVLEECVGDELNLHDMHRSFESHREVHDPDRQIPEELMDSGYQMLTEFFDRHAEDVFKVIAKEMPFQIVIGSALISGYIDLVESTSQGIKIIDYKSGKFQVAAKDVPTDIQLGIYALAMSHMFPGETIRAELYYLRPGTTKSHTYTEEDLFNMEQLVLEKVNQIIEDRHFKYTDTVWPCSFCDFSANKVCPVGTSRRRK